MEVIELSENILCSKSGYKMYWMITSEMGAKNFELRYIEIPPRGKNEYKKHPHEHEVYIVKGQGIIKHEEIEKELKPGLAVFIPGDEGHQWINTSETEPLGFICVVPKGAEAHVKPPC